MRRPPRPRLTVEVCEDRLAPAVVRWVSDQTGNWSDPARWSDGRVPQAGDEVVIDRPAADPTVVIDVDIAPVASIASREAIQLGNLGASAPTLRGAVTLTGGGVVRVHGGTAAGVRLDGPVVRAFGPASSGVLTVRDGLTLVDGATVEVSAALFDGTQALAGRGTLVAVNSGLAAGAVRVLDPDDVLTVEAGVTLVGRGDTLGLPIGDPDGGRIRLRGTVQADTPNQSVELENVTFDGPAATVRAAAGTVVALLGELSAAGGALRADANGGRILVGAPRRPAVLAGGTLDVAAGPVEVVAATFRDLTVAGPVDVPSGGLTVDGRLTLNGTLTVGSVTGNGPSQLVLRPGAVLAGDGTVRLTATNGRGSPGVTAEGAAAVAAGATVRLTGTNFAPAVTAAGQLTVTGTLDLTAPGPAAAVGVRAAGGLVNAGRVRVGGGVAVTVTGEFTNAADGILELVAVGTGAVTATETARLGGTLTVTGPAGLPPAGRRPVVTGREVIGQFTAADLPSGLDVGYDRTTAFLRAEVVPPPPPPTAAPRLVGFPQFAAGTADRVQFFNPDRSPRFALDPFPEFAVAVRTAAADFNGDGVADVVAGTGPGSPTRVRVLDGATQAELFAVDPFEATFAGGVYVAAGDLDGDGTPDLVVTPDEGGGPRVDVFRGNGFTKTASFFGIDDPAFRGGARAGTGDLNGDGVADLLVVAGSGGGPRVAAFDGKSVGGTPARLFGDFFAFETGLRNGVFVTAGDIDGDGFAELIAGGGPGGGPRVTAFDGKALLGNQQVVRANFFGGDTSGRGGIRVAVKNLDGDARADLVVGAGTGGRVTAYLGKDIGPIGTPPAAFDLDAGGGAAGVFVG